MSTAVTLSAWAAMGGAAASCLIGGLAVLIASAIDPGPPRTGPPPPPGRPGCLILDPPPAVTRPLAALPPGDTAPLPVPVCFCPDCEARREDGWQAGQRARLDQLERDVNVLHAQAARLFG